MNKKVTFFVPTITKTGKNVLPGLLKEFELACVDSFGGCTTTEARGTWKSSNGEFVTEVVNKVECLTDRTDFLKVANAFASHIKEAANQESVLFEIMSNGNVEGILV